jgi:hypothetical protein
MKKYEGDDRHLHPAIELSIFRERARDAVGQRPVAAL